MKYWGFSSFRPLQEDIITSVIEGNDTLALLPTGGGKSICFQVPAMAMEGICIVISPLIALMKDQVQNLKKRDISAIAIYSGMTYKEIDIALDNCIYGKTKFLYVSPERLTTDIFKARFEKMNVSMIAVDEAHCISQWGYDFRPPYLQIAELKQTKPTTPFIALTATATPEVVIDIQEKLEFKNQKVFQKSFSRPNLAYVVLYEEDKLNRLIKIVNKVAGSGVVYVRNRRRTKEIADFLLKSGVSADYYHAGLNNQQRDAKQQHWISNHTRIIVATNAFGMGIDKPDVRFVVHMDLADSLEAYFQEAGRAGRDEKKAYAIQLYSNNDVLEFEQQLQRSFPEIKQITQVYTALGNFFQLAVGSGQNETFDFNIAEFSERYSYKPLLVYNAFKFLETEGYISLSEAIHQPSRLLFVVSNEDLYRFQIANKKFDNFIKFLLRSYSGLFENYTNINEQQLAQRLKTTPEIVTQYLKKLHELNIIEFLPSSNTPKITYLTERLSDKNIRISKKHYDFRKKVAYDKMKGMLNYVTHTSKCRSQLLLSYFGEMDSKRCGVCDICLERNKLELSNMEFEQVSDQLKSLLSNNELTLTEAVNAIQNTKEDKTLKVLEWLIENGKIMQIEGKLSWAVHE